MYKEQQREYYPRYSGEEWCLTNGSCGRATGGETVCDCAKQPADSSLPVCVLLVLYL